MFSFKTFNFVINIACLHWATARTVNAKNDGIVLTDSNVKSALRKAMTMIKGSEPKNKPLTDKDKVIYLIADKISFLAEPVSDNNEDATFQEVSKSDWLLALRAVEDSLKLRKSGEGSRAYLEFVRNFIKSGGLFT